MSEWPVVRLESLGKIVTGKTPPASSSENYGDAIPFVTPSDMDGRKYILSTVRLLSAKGVETVQNALIPKASVMVSCIGSDMGKAAIAGQVCVTNQQLNSIIVNAENCAEYVYYNLSKRKDEIKSAASGSAQPILNKTAFSRLPIKLAPLTEQIAIASVLGALDDKIDLNRRMNETLEQTARALFKDWFVDFGPTKAKMAGQAAYLEGELWDLFPEQLGEAGVPEGWQNFQLAEIAKHCKNTISPMKNPEKMFEHYSLPAFDNGQEPVLDSGASIKSNNTDSDKSPSKPQATSERGCVP